LADGVRARVAAAEARLNRLDAAPETPTTALEREVINETLRRLLNGNALMTRSRC